MLQVMLLLYLMVLTLVHAIGVQAPSSLGSSRQGQDEHYTGITILEAEDLAEWSLDNPPKPTSVDHLVFETVHSLLQHWPNTRVRNGHTIIPGAIPKGTLLYHGTPVEALPAGPEWVATDPEHSYLFSRNVYDPTQRGGWQLTLTATRPLRIVYFDGNSAAKLTNGTMDTQDLLIWGRTGDPFEDERNRAQDLCLWGQRFGIDGFMRMEMNFEAILCDFTTGVSVVSFTELASGSAGLYSVSAYEFFEAIHSGTWHNHFPGETRIQLDLPGMVSFYDTKLAPSLVAIRAGQERWDHRVLGISDEDLSVVKFKLEANLMRPDGASSGIDWKTLVQAIVNRYGERLDLTRYLLSSATNSDNIMDFIKKAHTQLRVMLTPYLLLSAIPNNLSDKADLSWTVPIYNLCATAHTYSMESRFDHMTDSEELLLQAVRGTNKEICRVVTRMWAAGVYAGIDPSLNNNASPDIAEISLLRDTWMVELNDLMSWLDWNMWVKCNPGCGFEEMCYLPTWPVGFPWLRKEPFPVPIPPPDDYMDRRGELSSFDFRAAALKRMANEMSNAIKPEPGEWIRPQPKCIRRIKPYPF